MKRVALLAPLLLLAALLAAGSAVERFVNRVEPAPLPSISQAALRLHASSFVVDLHGDSLLFGRDLLERSDRGHIDLPRLREGGVGLQVLTVPTRVPLGFNIERTSGSAPDLLTLAAAARLSADAWSGPLRRSLRQAGRLESLARRSGGGLVPVRTRAELDALVARRAGDGAAVGALLGLEGAHALEGDPAQHERVFAAGYRMVGLTHFFDNGFAGSAHGTGKGGLTPRGEALLRDMERRGALVDLAHASPATVADVLARARRPVVFSHGGVRGTCDNRRNLSDEQVRAIARGGGVIGIGYWRTAVCGIEPRHVVAALRHVIALVGDDHPALGSDFDGGITTAFDTSGLAVLTQQMLDEGLPEPTIRKVLGGNALRVLRAVLP